MSSAPEPVEVENFLCSVPVICMPRWAVMKRSGRNSSEDIAWFWSKRLAHEYILFKQSQHKPSLP